MTRHILVALSLTLLHATSGAAQDVQALDGARLVSMSTVPETPDFGRVFDLHVTVRVAPGYTAHLSETLLPSRAAESVGPVRRQTSAAPGDSLDVEATYPVIGYSEGRLDLPSLEIRTLVVPGGAASIADSGSLASAELQVIPLGAVIVPEFAAMSDSGAVLVPRPAADVVGSEWSLWLLIAVGVLSAAGLGGAARVAPRWWRATGGALLTRLRQSSPKEDALRELDRIRSLGWHRNGRVDDFYASSTATLREFAQSLDPSWSAALTSTELLQKIQERWGDHRSEPLLATIALAERVKFSDERPEVDAAEADWTSIRDWVRKAPES